MNSVANTTRSFVCAASIALTIQLFTASPALAVPTPPLLWAAGGLSAGSDSAGQSARMASD